MTDSPNTTAMPDAELLALGEILDRLIDEHRRAVRTCDDPTAYRLPRQVYLAAKGASRRSAPARHPDVIMSELDEPARRIRQLKATTLAGIAVKARLARLDCYGHFDADKIRRGDLDVWSMHSLIEGVLELAAAGAPIDASARAG
jgi:hypothetical protein